MKQAIEKAKGFAASAQRIIFSGKVLKNDAMSLQEAGVAANAFLVVMVSKSKHKVCRHSANAAMADVDAAHTLNLEPSLASTEVTHYGATTSYTSRSSTSFSPSPSSRASSCACCSICQHR